MDLLASIGTSVVLLLGGVLYLYFCALVMCAIFGPVGCFLMMLISWSPLMLMPYLSETYFGVPGDQVTVAMAISMVTGPAAVWVGYCNSDYLEGRGFLQFWRELPRSLKPPF